ncbi:MAG: hemagglutinin repeat-containing protein [Pelosinus sp.]|nr:hemagglutinin repeat-containing protein [Pelosinus sp.]
MSKVRKIQRRRIKKLTACVTLCLYLLQPGYALAAGVVADPNAVKNKQPFVDRAANGTVIVQIASPSAAGLSHNLYQDFNVDTKGLILNNARLITSTKLAGYITGNPNLAGGSAKIILNEVTGSNQSSLNGYVEIAGSKADLIIANPNGIIGNGFGFINAGRTTLTTGTPIFGGSGSLEAFRVTGGQIAIQGNGLDGNDADRVDLISQATKVNAGIWAKELNVVTGNNEVNYNDLSVQKLSDANTSVALDVGQLGGMYAGKIKLIGTAQGVGVNSQGTISALQGNLYINQEGKILLAGSTSATGNVTVIANDQISNQGNLASQQNMDITTSGMLCNTGILAAGQNAILNANAVNSSGVVGAGIQTDGSIGLSGNLIIQANQMVALNGQNLAAGIFTVQGAELNLAAAKTNVRGDISLTANAGDINHSRATLQSSGAVSLTAANLVDNTGGTLVTKQNLNVQGINVTNTQGMMQAGKDLLINSQTLINQKGSIASLDNSGLKIQTTKSIDNTIGDIKGNGDVQLTAGAVVNASGQVTASGDILLTASGQLNNNQGTILSGKDVSIAAQTVASNGTFGAGIQNDGSVGQSGNLNINAAGTIQATGKNLSGGNLTVIGTSINQSGAVTVAGGDVQLTATTGDVDNTGAVLQTNGTVAISARGTLKNDKDGSGTAGQIMGKQVSITAQAISNRGGSIQQSGTNDTLIHSQGDADNTQGSILTNGALTLQAQRSVINQQGLVQAGKSLSIAAQSLENQNGSLLSLDQSKLTVTTSQEIDNTAGKIGGNGDINVSASMLGNAGGALISGGNLVAEVAGNVVNAGGNITAQQNINIGTANSIGTFSNTATGSISAGGNLVVNANNVDNNQGKMAANQDITIGAVSIQGGGTALAGRDISLTASGAIHHLTGGDFAANRNVSITANTFTSEGSILGVNDVIVNTQSIMNNAGARLAGGVSTSLNAANGLTNGGSISGSTLNITAQTANNSGAVSADMLTLTANTLRNDGSQAKIIANQAADLTVNTALNNTNGALIYNLAGTGALTVKSNALTNSGSILSGKDASIIAQTVASNGTFGTGIQNDGSLGQSGNLNINAAGTIQATGKNLSGGNLIVTGTSINQSGAITVAGGNVQLTAITGDIDNTGAVLQTNGTVAINVAGTLKNDKAASGTAGQIMGKQVSLTAQDISNHGGSIQQSGTSDTLIHSQGGVDNTQGTILTNGALTLQAQQSLINQQGLIQAGKGVAITAQSLENKNGSLLSLDQSKLTVTISQGIDNTAGKIGGNGDVNVSASMLGNAGGALISGGNLVAEVSGDVDNAGGNIKAQQDVNIGADNHIGALSNTVNGSISAGGNLAVNADSVDNHQGKLAANQDITISAANIQGGGTALAGRDINLAASGDIHHLTGGDFEANRNVSITANTFTSEGSIIGVNDVIVNTQSIMNNAGARLAGGVNTSLNAANGMTNGGSISGSTLNITAQTANNSGAVSADTLTLTVNTLSNDGSQAKIIANQAADLTANTALNNTNGALIYNLAGTGALTVKSNALTNSGTILSGKDASITAQTVASNGTLGAGIQNDGSLGQSGNLNINAADTIQATGKNLSGGNLTVTGTSINQSGAVTVAGGNVQLTATTGDIDNTGAVLQTNGTVAINAAGILKNDKAASGTAGQIMGKQVSVTAQAISNRGGSIQQSGINEMLITSQTKLDNTSGMVITNGQLQVNSGDINNQGGVIAAQSQASIRSQGTVDNSSGTLYMGGLMLTAAGDVLNSNGKIQENNGASITAQNINNTNGSIIHIGTIGSLSITANQKLTNQAGLIGSNGALTIIAGSVDNANNHMLAQGDFSLQVNSDFTNLGTLQSNGVLSITAPNLNNTAGGAINANQANLTVNGSITNDGRIEGNQIIATAQTMTNNATVIGGTVTLTANNITNQGQPALIAATDTINLWVGNQLLNQDGANIISLGNINIAANNQQDANGLFVNRTQLVTNKAATIEADGNLNMAAENVQNLASGDPVIGTKTSTSAVELNMAPHVVYYIPGGQDDNGNYVLNSAQYGGPAQWGNGLNGLYLKLSITVPKANVIAYDASQKKLVYNDVTSTPQMLVNGPGVSGYLDANQINSFFSKTVTCDDDSMSYADRQIYNYYSARDGDNRQYSYTPQRQDYTILPVYQGTSNRGDNIGSVAVATWAGKVAGQTTAYCQSVQVNANGDYIISFYPGYVPGINLDPENSHTAAIDSHLPNAAEEKRVTTTVTETQYIKSAPSIGQIRVGQNMGFNIGQQFTNQYSQVAIGNAVVGNIGTLQNQGYRLIQTSTTTDQSYFHDWFVTGGGWDGPELASATGTDTFGPYISNTYIDGGLPATFIAKTISLTGNNVNNIEQRPDGTTGPQIGSTITLPSTGGVEVSGNNQPEEVAVGPVNTSVGQLNNTAQTAIQAGNNPVTKSGTTISGVGISGNTTASNIGTSQLTAAPTAVQGSNEPVKESGTVISGTAVNSTAIGSNTGTVGSTNNQAVIVNQNDGTTKITIPQNALYKTSSNPTAKYIVETDPRFANYKNFISSDYMLQRLNYDPSMTQKRLGDAFYEQKVVDDQITQLTGRRYLSGYSDSDAEYRALMDSGVSEGKALNLTPGIALTAAQVGNLTQDMVWMVEKDVTLSDGTTQKALVPQVYLCKGNTIDLKSSGALISADTVDFKLSGNVTNSGTIAGAVMTSIQAANLLNKNGGVIGGTGETRLVAVNDIINQSTITGSQVITVAGRDIKNETTSYNVTASLTQNGHSWIGSNTVIGTQATISAQGNLTLVAGRDVSVQGATIAATGDTLVNAGRDLLVGTVVANNTGSDQTAHRSFSYTDIHNVTSGISGNNVSLISQGDTHLTGIQVNASSNLTVAVQGNLTVDNVKDVYTQKENYNERGARYAGNKTDETVVGSNLLANKDITITALNSAADKGNISMTASSVTSQNGTITLAAAKNISIQNDTEKHESLAELHTSGGGFFSSNSDSRDYSLLNQVKGSTISGDQVKVVTGGDLRVTGSNVVGTNDVNLVAQGNINIASAQQTGVEDHYYHETSSGIFSGGIGFTVGKRSTTTTDVQQATTQIGSTIGSTNGNVNFDAGKNVDVTASDIRSNTKDVNIIGQNVTITSANNTNHEKHTYEFSQSGLSVSIGNQTINNINSVYQPLKRSSQVVDSRLKALYDYKAVTAANNISKGKTPDGSQTASKDNSLEVSVSIGTSKQESQTDSLQVTTQQSTIAAGGNVNITATGSGAKDTDGKVMDGNINIIGSSVNGQDITLNAAKDINLTSAENTTGTQTTSSSSSAGVGVTMSSKGTGVFVNGSKANTNGDGNTITHTNTTVTATNTLTIKSGQDTNLIGAQVAGETVKVEVGRNLNLESQQDVDQYNETSSSAGGAVTVGAGAGITGSASRGKIDSNYQSVTQQTGIYAGNGGFDVQVGNNTNLKGAVIASEATADKNILSTDTLTYSDIQNKADYSASSSGFSLDSRNKTPIVPTPSIPVNGKADSTTKSAISNGTIEVRSGNVDLTKLNRNTDQALNSLGKIFDKKAVQEKQELVNLFSQEVNKAVGDLSEYMREKAATPEEKAKWAEGGEYKALLHAVTAGITSSMSGDGFASGAMGDGISQLAQKQLGNIKDLNIRLIASMAVGAAAAKVVGGNAQVGGATAYNGVKYNEYIHRPTREGAILHTKDGWFQIQNGVDTPIREPDPGTYFWDNTRSHENGMGSDFIKSDPSHGVYGDQSIGDEDFIFEKDYDILQRTSQMQMPLKIYEPLYNVDGTPYNKQQNTNIQTANALVASGAPILFGSDGFKYARKIYSDGSYEDFKVPNQDSVSVDPSVQKAFELKAAGARVFAGSDGNYVREWHEDGTKTDYFLPDQYATVSQPENSYGDYLLNTGKAARGWDSKNGEAIAMTNDGVYSAPGSLSRGNELALDSNAHFTKIDGAWYVVDPDNPDKCWYTTKEPSYWQVINQSTQQVVTAVKDNAYSFYHNYIAPSTLGVTASVSQNFSFNIVSPDFAGNANPSAFYTAKTITDGVFVIGGTIATIGEAGGTILTSSTGVGAIGGSALTVTTAVGTINAGNNLITDVQKAFSSTGEDTSTSSTGSSDSVQKVEYGDQYTKVDGKKALKSNVEYTTEEGYKYNTDSNGRISSVEANLESGIADRNNYAQRTVGGADRLPTDDGGHLIASIFKGSGNIDNLVPMDATLNRSEYKTLENTWRSALQEGKEVNVKINPMYEGNSVRPSEFKINYTIDGKKYSTRLTN